VIADGMVTETTLELSVDELRAFDREDSPACHSRDEGVRYHSTRQTGLRGLPFGGQSVSGKRVR
jgi:hypothetical protein